MRLIVWNPVNLLSPILFFGCLSACAPSPPHADALIASAKAVVTNHERLFLAGDLDGVMSNFAPDIVVLAPGAPFMEGLDAMREFYASWLASGSFESTTHDYSGAEVVGNGVVLHGIAESTLVPPEGPPIRMVNNFLHVLKPDETGVMKFWRSAFAPPSM